MSMKTCQWQPLVVKLRTTPHGIRFSGPSLGKYFCPPGNLEIERKGNVGASGNNTKFHLCVAQYAQLGTARAFLVVVEKGPSTQACDALSPLDWLVSGSGHRETRKYPLEIYWGGVGRKQSPQCETSLQRSPSCKAFASKKEILFPQECLTKDHKGSRRIGLHPSLCRQSSAKFTGEKLAKQFGTHRCSAK